MKRLIIAAFLAAATFIGAFAQNAEELYRSFSNEKGAESVKVGSFICKLASVGAKADKDNDKDDRLAASILGDVASIYVLDMSDCNETVKNYFRNAVVRIETAGYEKLMELSDDDDRAVIYMKRSGDRIQDFILYSVGDDPCMVDITGNFKMSDVQALIACAEDRAD